jgi:hypothetical protein
MEARFLASSVSPGLRLPVRYRCSQSVSAATMTLPCPPGVPAPVRPASTDAAEGGGVRCREGTLADAHRPTPRVGARLCGSGWSLRRHRPRPGSATRVAGDCRGSSHTDSGLVENPPAPPLGEGVGATTMRNAEAPRITSATDNLQGYARRPERRIEPKTPPLHLHLHTEFNNTFGWQVEERRGADCVACHQNK